MSLAAAGVFASFIAHDYLQEQLVLTTGGHLPLTMTSFEFFFCAVLAALLAPRADAGTSRWMAHGAIAACLLGSLALGNTALRFVSFPAKVVLKSTKLLPAMAVGRALLGKRYDARSYAAAALLCAGVIGCTIAERSSSSSSPSAERASSTFGVALLLAAVLCDAVSPVLQERLLRYRDVEPLQLMQRTNTLAFLGTAAAWAATGESTAVAAAATRLESPTRFVLLLSLYGATSFTGVVCMLALIERWGSAAGVAAGTLRKVLTVVLSFVAFPKGPPSPTFAISALAVLAAVVLHARAPKQGGGGGGGDGGRAAEEEEKRKKKRRKPKPMKGVNGARLKF
jgi:drug/metabolite transporter (DMT)-like permease